MDYILIFSSSNKEEHLHHVSMVLATLLHHSLFAKGILGCSSVAFLCHMISADQRKIAAVSWWAPPASCTDVCHFVRLANYYHKFVNRFANLAAHPHCPVQPSGLFLLELDGTVQHLLH